MKPVDFSVDTPLEVLNSFSHNTLMANLGIIYTKVEEGFVEGEMPIDARTIQPVGILHGGASLAFAETLGGLGSAVLIDSAVQLAVGTQVSANHVGMAKGDKVRGEARIIHKGRRTHVWNIDVFGDDNRLISSVRLTNQIIER